MQLDQQKACFGWLLDSVPVKLLWRSALDDAARKAAAEGRIDVLTYMLEAVHVPKGMRWTPRTPHSAAERWIPGACECMAAAAAGQMDVLKWLRTHADQRAWTPWVCQAAIEANQLETLQWLHLLRDPACGLRSENMDAAACMGRLDMLQLLRSTDRPCPWEESVCMYAAMYPECLKWLRQQDPPCPWDHRSMQTAAGAGQLSLMQWMRAQDPPCPMTASSMEAAAESGHLEIMKWLHSQEPPCPVNSTCLYNAVVHGNLAKVQWVCQQLPSSCRPSICLWGAIGGGDKNLELVQWMLLHGFEQPRDPVGTLSCAGAGGLSMLQWLHKAGYPLDPDCAYRAAAAGHTRLLAWLLNLGAHHCKPGSNLGFECPPTSSILMLWGDHEQLPDPNWQVQLCRARATFCTFHGLVRWCRRHLSESSRISQAAQGRLPFSSQTNAGQQLLVNLARLPDDLVIKIAVAADLQYDPALQPSKSCAA